MKKFLFIVMCVMLAACSTTPEERAEQLVTNYIKSVAHEPSSVQDVEVGTLVDDAERDLHGNIIRFKYATITYRAKNASGALVRSDYITVKFDSDVTEIICYDCFR